MNFSLLLYYFVLGCAVSFVTPQPYLQIEGRGRVLGSADDKCKIFTKCVLTCDVDIIGPGSVGQFIPLAPLVTWERYAGNLQDRHRSDKWRRLYDEYWIRNRGIHYSSNQGQNICPRNGTYHGTYHCKFVQNHCCSPNFDGLYRCKVTVHHVIRRIDQIKEVALTTFHRDAGECFMPTVQDFTAEHNSTNIMLRWDAISGGIPCDRSRRFMVSISLFDSYEDYLIDRSIFSSPYTDTMMRRDKHFTIPLSDMKTLNRYYVFKVRNQYISGNISSSIPIVVVRSQVHTSDIYFFGNQEPAQLVSPVMHTTNMRVRSGHMVLLRCEARGFPVPSITLWFRDSFVPSQSNNPLVIQKELVITPESAGLYKCSASNTFVKPTGGAIPAFIQKFINLEVYEKNDSNVLCSPIKQSSCGSFLLDQRVIFNTSDINLEAEVERVVSDLQHAMENSNESVNECLTLAHAVVCHSSFPFCYDHEISRKVCKSTCDHFRPGGACASIIDRPDFSDTYRVIFSNCDNQTSPAGSKPECIYVPFREETARSWCHSGNGHNYAGNVIRTNSNKLCQDWVSENPHRHPIYSSTELHSATNQCRNPGARGMRPWCYTVKPNQRWEYCDVPQCEVCEIYAGQFCQDFPGYDQRSSVYINRHELEWTSTGQTGAEVWMLTEFINIFHPHFNGSDSCLAGIKEMICHNALPLCHTTSGGSPVPMKLCSNHCKALKLLQVCRGELIQKLQEDMILSGYTFPELECNIVTESNGDCLTTQALSLTTAIAVSDAVSCYNSTDLGKGYIGNISTSLSGTLCQQWGSVLPGAKNYCRNPHQVGERLWCFTNTELTQWQYCDVPACGDVTSQDSIVSKPVSDQVPNRSTHPVISATISALLVVIVLGLGLTFGVIMWSYNYMRKKKMEANSHLHKISLERSAKWDYNINEMYSKVEQQPLAWSPKLAQTIESFPRFDKSCIRYIRQLGQGNFGVVFYAKAEGLLESEKETEVAVKTLKEETCSEALEDFVREAKLMFSFDHPNVIKIFSVAMESIPYYLIFEFMDKGDLTQFLRANASSLQRRLMNPLDGRPRSRTESTASDDPPSLNFDQLTDICKQIAAGMKYLADKRHVHRDLACRNCLVKSCDREQTESGLIIKIGDFGMSHNLYNADYYRVKGSAILPVRWMSPEAIIYGKFSTESDVWSFGVVMWEVFSFAMQPYYGTSNEEVTEAIRRHKILKKPTDCCISVYEIMKSCWNQESTLRPTFECLCIQLDESRSSISSGSSEASPSLDDFNSNCSDLDSDAFLEENSVDGLDAAL